MSNQRNIIVIGGGAAGMIAAIAAAKEGCAVSLYEKNEKLGKKIFITGKGRCNVTNAGDMDELFGAVITNKKFMFSSFYGFTNEDMMQFLEDAGLRLKTERGKRVFPLSDHSSDVIAALERTLKKENVKVYLRKEVKGLNFITEEDKTICKGIFLEENGKKTAVDADCVIVATGGMSYPSTGSTGDGYQWAQAAGLKVTALSPALVPFETAELEIVKSLQGLSLKNVEATVSNGKKELYRDFGEMLFTHFGVSGPLMLSASSFCAKAIAKNLLKLSIDLKPALTEEQLDERILRDFAEAKNKQFKNSLNHLYPAKLVPVIIERSGIDPDKQVNEISVGEQQRVEILKALYRGAELLILDEPTAALTDQEVEGLFSIMGRLTAENKSVIFISHKMREVMAVSDRVTILRAGQTITTVDKKDTDGAQLANLMIGHEMTVSAYKKVTEPGEDVLRLLHVDYQKDHKHSGLNNVSFSIGKGEILGVAGVDGNGQSQLAQLVTGVISPDSGEVELNSHKVAQFAPNGFILSNVSHVPEDRNKMGLVGNMTVEENLVLKATEEPRFSYAHGALLKKKAIRKFALELQKKNDIRCASIEQEARNLSGGNQQKIILAREMENHPELLVAVHPTRGLDIGASQYVHDTMIEARDKGCGILLISADFDEVLKLSDRILVMFEGQVMGIYSGENPPVEEISLAMAGKEE
mgnify:CR=1 FL=1